MLREHSAGERNKQITIQQLTQDEDSSGMPLEVWTTLTTAQASYMPLGGRERLAADHLTSPFDGQFQMAYRPDMDPNLLNVPKMRRIVYDGRVHDIVAASMVGQKRAVELMTASGGATA
jgi:SPP1 family predicted phage head-tail adaptor